MQSCRPTDIQTITLEFFCIALESPVFPGIVGRQQEETGNGSQPVFP